MIKADAERIAKYITYLRTLIEESNFTTDEDILEMFRHCFCCGEELITKSEQMHAILEFDTPKRVHKKLYENL